MGLSAQALVELQRAFQAVEETDGGQLDQKGFIAACMQIKSLMDAMRWSISS
jgi:hypothetical protein